MNFKEPFVKKPLVSIILPSLNVVDYIEETIRSVQTQSYGNIEIICVDAGSSDGTVEIIKRQMEHDNRISLINSTKRSYGYQVNVGIKEARGDYVCIVETDDFIEKEYVSVLVDYANDNNCDFVKGDYYEVSGSEKDGYEKERKCIFYEGSLEYNHLYSKNKIDDIFMRDKYIWNGLYRKEYLVGNNIRLNESQGAAFQDVGFLVQTIFMANSFGYINVPIYNYRVDREGASVNNKNSFFITCAELEWIFNSSCWISTIDKNKDEFKKRAAKDFYGSLICTLEKNDFRIDGKLRDIWKKYSNTIQEWIDNGHIDELSYDVDTWENILLASNNLDQFIDKWSGLKMRGPECFKDNENDLPDLEGRWEAFSNLIFASTTRRIVVFGAGAYFLHFLKAFGYIYKPRIILDNNNEVQGTKVEGIPVKSPSYLLDMNSDEIIIVICAKSYKEIIEQINSIGNFLYYTFSPRL